MPRKKKRPTKAQLWQRERYQAKGSLVSFKNRVESMLQSNFLTAGEMIMLKHIIPRIKYILEDWEDQNSASKRKYLSCK